MCLRSKDIDISYRSRYFYPSFAQPVNVVCSCGTCSECINFVRTDYFIRCYSEYSKCLSSGGCVAFVTFTYRNSDVPVVRYSLNSDSTDIEFTRVPFAFSRPTDLFCFDKTNLQRFFNSYRKFFERLCIKSPFRYFVVPEYGSDSRYTQRPHFHGLLFLSEDVKRLYSLPDGSFDDSTFLSDVSKYWKHGICSASKKGLLVESFHSIKYCCKYISKSVCLNVLRRFKSFYNFLISHPNLSPSDYRGNSVSSLFVFYLKRAGSNLFVLKSRCFGLCAIDSLFDLKSKFNYSELAMSFDNGFSYVDNSEVKTVPFSFYYFRKLFYDVREDGSFILNSAGYHYKRLSFTNSYIKFLDSLSTVNFDELLSSPLSRYCDFCKHFVRNYSSLYFVYVRLLRGYSFPLSFSNFLYKYFSSHSHFDDVFLDTVFRYKYGYIYCLDIYDDFLIDSLSKDLSFIDYKRSHPLTYSDSFFIDDFELFYRCLSYLQSNSKSSIYANNEALASYNKLLTDIKNFKDYEFSQESN